MFLEDVVTAAVNLRDLSTQWEIKTALDSWTQKAWNVGEGKNGSENNTSSSCYMFGEAVLYSTTQDHTSVLDKSVDF